MKGLLSGRSLHLSQNRINAAGMNYQDLKDYEMPISYLTKEGFDNLQKELDDLRNNRRKEIAIRLQEALEDGELIEKCRVRKRKK